MCQHAKKYLQTIPTSKGTGLASFFKADKSFILADVTSSFQHDFLILLRSMLLFNPKMRITSAKALSYKFFQSFFPNLSQTKIESPLLEFQDIERCKRSHYPQNMRALMTDDVNKIHSSFASSSGRSFGSARMFSLFSDTVESEEKLLLEKIQLENAIDENAINVSQLSPISETGENDTEQDDGDQENPRPKRIESCLNQILSIESELCASAETAIDFDSYIKLSIETPTVLGKKTKLETAIDFGKRNPSIATAKDLGKIKPTSTYTYKKGAVPAGNMRSLVRSFGKLVFNSHALTSRKKLLRAPMVSRKSI
jgi:serine/threonine protein kinase